MMIYISHVDILLIITKKTTSNMIDFWNNIPNNYKIDLTKVGHWSGTRLVCFDNINNKFICDN